MSAGRRPMIIIVVRSGCGCGKGKLCTSRYLEGFAGVCCRARPQSREGKIGRRGGQVIGGAERGGKVSATALERSESGRRMQRGPRG